jgi:hypothetical protein
MAVVPAWDRDASTLSMVRCNPLHANPLTSRADLARGVSDLVRPLLPYVSDGSARLRVGAAGMHYGAAAGEMEAMVRPIWGLAPLLGGGFAFAQAGHWARALASGTDPAHPEYWGDVGPRDQRSVEMSGLSLGILLAPDHLWQPLSEVEQDNAARWLGAINREELPDNNWLFFRVLTNLALRSVGKPLDEDATRAALDRLDTFYLGGGYYRDGTKWNQQDYYTPMALHFYGLVLARVAPDLFPEHAARFRERARLYAQDFQHWFADDGAAIPFGRSMTYRFVQSAFWSACAFAGEEVLPWGRIKGLVLRNLRWWSERPAMDRDGVLGIGYAYPNLMMSEAYNAPGSSYWALKTFLILALPEDHPFWMAEEEAPESLPDGRIETAHGGFVFRRGPGEALMLTGGQDGREHRCHDAKYGRFAYSSAFAFSVGSDAFGQKPDRTAIDNGIAVSRDAGTGWISRSTITQSGMDLGMPWGVWQPDDGLSIESWVDVGPAGWHVRLHRITTDQPLLVAEGGFSIDRTGDGHMTPHDWVHVADGLASVRSLSALSGLRDLNGVRPGEVVRVAPNTNLRFPRTLMPRLLGTVPAGTSWLATAVFGAPDPDATPASFALPATVRALCAREDLDTSGWRLCDGL